MNTVQRKRWSGIAFALLLPLAVGGLAAALAAGGMARFGALNQPPLTPPGWLFPVVWTVLYLLMGYAGYLLRAELPLNDAARRNRRAALFLYALQLFFNFVWPLLFFRAGLYAFAFLWLLVLWLLLFLLIRAAAKTRKLAAVLLLPYLAWVTFAGYLNLMIAVLN